MPAFKFINHIKHNKGLRIAILLVVSILTDQTTKFLARGLLQGSREICFSHCFIQFSLIENHGGFLGVVNNLPENIRFFLLTICVSVLLLGCLVYLFYFNKKRVHYDLPLVFVAGGGIGNLLDRLLQNGGVTDFLTIGVGNVRTGIFNLADVYILIGSFVLGFMLFSTPEETAQSG